MDDSNDIHAYFVYFISSRFELRQPYLMLGLKSD